MVWAIAGCSPMPTPHDAGDAGASEVFVARDAGADGEADGGELTFARDIFPMFVSAGCATANCHGTLLNEAGVLFFMSTPARTYQDLLDRRSIRRPEVLVRAGAPAQSVLVEHSEGTLLQMNILDADRAQRVRQWVQNGAMPGDLESSPEGDAGADAGVDAGVIGGACSVENSLGFPPLPSGCLPRCAQATWNTVVACRAEANPLPCQEAAIRADPTMETMIPGIAGVVVPVNCSGCLDWQTNACLFEHCYTEQLAFVRCRIESMGGACAAETAAVQQCAQRSMEFFTCRRTREQACAGL